MSNDLPLVINLVNTNPKDKYRFIHNFVPHPHLKTRARLISNPALGLYSLLLVALLGAFNVIPKVLPGVLGYASNIKVSELTNLTNKTREENGLGDLKMNSALSKAAEKKAQDMFKNNYWAHVSPTGTEPWDFILAEDYDYSYAGENLAKNFNSSKEVVTAWYNSPSHKENLLNKNYTEMGFAVVNGTLDGYKTTLVVQMFGKPRSTASVSAAENKNKILESVSAQPEVAVEAEKEPVALEKPVAFNTESLEGSVLPALDISIATKYISVAFGTFILSLFALDYWYSMKKGIPRLTGHTIVHIAFLLVAVIGVWFALSPGKVL